MKTQPVKRPKVVNCTREACTHYCGRPASYRKAIGSPIDLSVLGNPFTMAEESDRIMVVDKYRIWLWKRLKEGGKELVALKSIKIGQDIKLGCFCAPRACHCDVIADAWEWLKSLPK